MLEWFCLLFTLFHAVPFFGPKNWCALFSAGSTNGATQSSFGNEAGAGHGDILEMAPTKNFLKGVLERGFFCGIFYVFFQRLPTSFNIYLFFWLSRLDFHILGESNTVWPNQYDFPSGHPNGGGLGHHLIHAAVQERINDLKDPAYSRAIYPRFGYAMKWPCRKFLQDMLKCQDVRMLGCGDDDGDATRFTRSVEWSAFFRRTPRLEYAPKSLGVIWSYQRYPSLESLETFHRQWNLELDTEIPLLSHLTQMRIS